MSDKKEKRASNFMLALRSIRCDFISTLKSWYVIAFLFFMAIAVIPAEGDDDKAYLTFCFMYLMELYLSKFTPKCKRIYYMLPFTTEDRIAIMKWRVHIVEVTILLYAGIGAVMQQLVYHGSSSILQIYAAALMAFLYEAISAVQYAGYRKEKKTRESVLGCLIGGAALVMVLVIFAVGIHGLQWMMIPIVIMMGVRWYFSTQADFTEYKYVSVVQLSAREEARKKEEEAV